MILAPFPKVHLSIRSDRKKVCSIELSSAECFSCEMRGEPPSELLPWLFSYASSSSPFLSPPLHLESLSPFQRKVLSELAKIPFGKTVSYGELASQCGVQKGARAVGRACHRNPFPLLVPCHRVIQGNGAIGGFATDLEIKRILLEFEGKRQFALT